MNAPTKQQNGFMVVEEILIHYGVSSFYTPDAVPVVQTVIVKNPTTRIWDWWRWNELTKLYEPKGHSYKPEGTYQVCPVC